MKLENIKRLITEYMFSAEFFLGQSSIACDNCRSCEYFVECRGLECNENKLFCTLSDCNGEEYTYVIDDSENMFYIRDYKNGMILVEEDGDD